MDIKIGNDVKLSVYLPEYIDTSSILKITAHLHRINNHCDHTHHCSSKLYYPSEYTMHMHTCTPYNVYPSNCVHNVHVCCRHCYYHFNYRHRSDITYINPNGSNNFDLWFKNTNCHDCGTYALTVKIQTHEDGWGDNNTHEYTVYYGPVFSISNNKDAKEGDVRITVKKCEIQNPDIEDTNTTLILNDGE